MSDGNIEAFIGYIAGERGLTRNTQISYRHDLEAAYCFCKEKQFSWPMTYDTVLLYMKYLQAKQCKETTQVRSLIAIKMFLRFLHSEGILATNESRLISSPKIWQTIPSIVTLEEVEAMIALPDCTTDRGLLEKALLEVLYGTGLRVSEVCGLTIYDVSDEMITVMGKGNKQRLVPIGKKALLAIDQYITYVRQKFDSDKNIFLFVTMRGKPLTRMWVWKMVKEYARKAGIKKSISPHTFRHTYASHLLDGGVDVRVIQDLLGHAHISSTDRYTQVSCGHIQESFKAFHPRWRKG